jgi:hypothetical protein
MSDVQPAPLQDVVDEPPPVPEDGGSNGEPPSLPQSPSKIHDDSLSLSLSENLPEEKAASDGAAQQEAAASQSDGPKGEDHSAEAQAGDIAKDGMCSTEGDGGKAEGNTDKACAGPEDMDGIIIDWKAAVAEAKQFKQSRQPRVPNKEHAKGELPVCLFNFLKFLVGKKKPF